jgi:subtilisin family serine protease
MLTRRCLQVRPLAKTAASRHRCEVTRRPFLAALALAVACSAATSPGASAISVTCADQPSNPVGYAVSAVHADQVAAPATTPAIAVLDTGVAPIPELGTRLRTGYNVAGGSQNTNDIDGHGTAVASIAAAAAGGVRGISPSTPIIPIKIFDDRGESTPQDFVAAIERAVALNAGVINVSAAASPSDLDPQTASEVKNAIYAAVSLGIPVIAASGNEGDARLDIPAALPHVIAVGATGPSGDVAAYSNSGTGLDLVAPGSEIVTAAPSALCSRGYGTVTGTSFAAPAVAGAAALILQKHPELDVGQVADMLRLRGIRNPAPGWTLETGFGLLDVFASLDGPVPSPDQTEVNDDIHWAKLQPSALTPAKRSRTLFARIAPHMDPTDVYQLRLKKGDRLQVRLQQPAGTKLGLSFGATKLAAKAGTAFSQRIKKAGNYFVGVAIQQSPPEGTGYALTLKR